MAAVLRAPAVLRGAGGRARGLGRAAAGIRRQSVGANWGVGEHLVRDDRIRRNQERDLNDQLGPINWELVGAAYERVKNLEEADEFAEDLHRARRQQKKAAAVDDRSSDLRDQLGPLEWELVSTSYEQMMEAESFAEDLHEHRRQSIRNSKKPAAVAPAPSASFLDRLTAVSFDAAGVNYEHVRDIQAVAREDSKRRSHRRQSQRQAAILAPAPSASFFDRLTAVSFDAAGVNYEHARTNL